jgi:hypothetical protein
VISRAKPRKAAHQAAERGADRVIVKIEGSCTQPGSGRTLGVSV